MVEMTWDILQNLKISKVQFELNLFFILICVNPHNPCHPRSTKM